MKNWYVSADLKRAANSGEAAQIGVSGASLYAGRIKTVVEASTPSDAIAKGRAVIEATLEVGLKAYNYGCMGVDDARALGDEETYASMRTV